MFNSKMSPVIVVLSIILLSLLFASLVEAVGETVNIDAHDTADCGPGAIISGTVTHNNGTAGANLRLTLSNNTRGTNFAFTSPLNPSGTHNYYIVVPAASSGGDSMTMTIDILDTGAGVLAVDTLNYNCPGTGATSSGSDSVSEPQPAFTDGRINAWDTGNSVVLYGFAEGNSRRLDIYSADGSGLILSIPATVIDAVAECPAGNTLIFSDAASGISLWRLPQRSDGSCPFQLNAPATEAGKTYVVVFDGLYTNTYYESWEQ